MKKLAVLFLLLSFGASAKTVCFEIGMIDLPFAADIIKVNRFNRTTIDNFELMPGQYLCKKYSRFKNKSLNLKVYNEGIKCPTKLSLKRDVTITIDENGCELTEK